MGATPQKEHGSTPLVCSGGGYESLGFALRPRDGDGWGRTDSN